MRFVEDPLHHILDPRDSNVCVMCLRGDSITFVLVFDVCVVGIRSGLRADGSEPLGCFLG